MSTLIMTWKRKVILLLEMQKNAIFSFKQDFSRFLSCLELGVYCNLASGDIMGNAALKMFVE